MADNIEVKAASTIPVATDVVTYSGDAGQNVQLLRPVLVTGAEGAKTVVDMTGDAANGWDVDVTRLPALVAGTANIGDVDVLTVPNDPFGVNADASSATGSISAKLKFLAAGIAGATSLPAGANNIGDVDVLTIAAGDNNIGNVDIVTVPADPFGANADAASATGSISAKLRFIAGTGIPVTGTVTVGSHAVTIDAAAVTSLALIDDTVFADDAGFTVTSSKVSAVGFMLDDTSTDSVDEGDVGVARMTADRRQLVQLGESGAKDVVGGGSQTGTSDQSIMAALASNYNYLCWLTVYNSSATNTFATLKDGSTTRAIIPLPAYGGAVLQWPRGLRSTSNTAWNVAAGASVTTAYFYGGGFTSTS